MSLKSPGRATWTERERKLETQLILYCDTQLEPKEKITASLLSDVPWDFKRWSVTSSQAFTNELLELPTVALTKGLAGF